jgi:predicted permease
MAVLVAGLARLPLPIPIPLELRAPSGPGIWGFALLLLVVATLLSGLVPAWQVTRPSLVPALKDADASGRRRPWSLRGLLVATQVAISMVLLVTALLFLRNLARTHRADPGFDTVHTTAAQVTFVIGRHDAAARVRLLDAAAARIATLPGVERASYAAGLPLTIRHGSTNGGRMWIDADGDARAFDAWWGQNAVAPGYFATMGIPLRGGREFDARDAAAGTRVVAMNEAFAERYLGGRPAVGLHLMVPGLDRHEPHEIVAVVGNGKYRSLGEEQMPALYFPYAQRPGDGRLAHVIARGPASGPDARSGMAAAIAGLDDTAAVEVRAMQDMLAFAFLPSRIVAALLGTLGTLGLVLAMGGLFALLSYAVAQRRRELGIRLALGATARSLVRLVVSEAALLVAAGLGIGLAIAVLVTRPLAAFLVAGLSPTDPVTLVGTALLFLLVSALTAWIPARRAARVDPVDVLRTL